MIPGSIFRRARGFLRVGCLRFCSAVPKGTTDFHSRDLSSITARGIVVATAGGTPSAFWPLSCVCGATMYDSADGLKLKGDNDAGWNVDWRRGLSRVECCDSGSGSQGNSAPWG